jgi:hypothetical protein
MTAPVDTQFCTADKANIIRVQCILICNDVGQGIFREIEPEECFSTTFYRWARNERLPLVRKRRWQEIESLRSLTAEYYDQCNAI